MRRTAFKWDDKARTLSWSVTGGSVQAPQMFTQLRLTLLSADGRYASGAVALGSSGSMVAPP